MRRRFRDCLNGDQGEFGCQGSRIEQSFCNGSPCPTYTSWSTWDKCSVTCGGGFRERQRICINGFEGQLGCDAPQSEREECNAQVW